MTEPVKFTCPECGMQWIEEQDPEDDWFKLATKQTLCDVCGTKAIKRILSDELHETAKLFRRNKNDKEWQLEK